MVETPSIGKDSVAVLFKGGRLPSWHALTADEQRAFSQEHVDLMLSVARKLQAARCVAPSSAATRNPSASSSSRPSGTEKACTQIWTFLSCRRAVSTARRAKARTKGSGSARKKYQ